MTKAFYEGPGLLRPVFVKLLCKMEKLGKEPSIRIWEIHFLLIVFIRSNERSAYLHHSWCIGDSAYRLR